MLREFRLIWRNNQKDWDAPTIDGYFAQWFAWVRSFWIKIRKVLNCFLLHINMGQTGTLAWSSFPSVASSLWKPLRPTNPLQVLAPYETNSCPFLNMRKLQHSVVFARQWGVQAKGGSTCFLFGDLEQRLGYVVGGGTFVYLLSFSFPFPRFFTIPQEGQTLADHIGLFFWETSALSGHHVSELLHDVGK